MPPSNPAQDAGYLGRLQDYFAEHRSLPSFSHIARLLGLRSVASAHAVAGRLKLTGFLQTTPAPRRSPSTSSSSTRRAVPSCSL